MQPIVLITGGSRGIGAATALAAAEAGYAVAVNYAHNSLAADEVVRQIRQQGGNAVTMQADVAQALVASKGLIHQVKGLGAGADPSALCFRVDKAAVHQTCPGRVAKGLAVQGAAVDRKSVV